ncbi:unnamed protein product [Angiostrongylus costaricensis]|uniref:Malic enzyme n=1 Tax=Angiostrongylus costaricensis TaxID=334426 RepID=A0A158PJ14_ANGCS|nr:unnamed protein product [Angiostrongylus costaricensis]
MLSSSTSLNAKEIDLNDPKQLALHKLYRPERVTPRERGYDLLKNPRLNKATFDCNNGVHGLLPPAFMTEEQQAYRVMKKLREQPDNLSKYIQLDELQNRTEKLFYRVLCDNVKELMPIVYTPTVGLACQKFDRLLFRGLYVTVNDNSISKIYQILSNWPVSNVQAIVVTDGERILGLGDLGCYGMGIPVGKLALYVALAGIQPQWCLPVVIDVGTDNQKLLDDPFYTGLRRRRVRGPEYELLLDNFIKAVTKRFGRHTLIQFEDFAFENAYMLLDRYKNDYCVFNDDIQGTASVVVAGLLATTRVTGQKLCDQKLVFFGAGEAGLGVAELCVSQMVDEGLDETEACDKIYMMDINGLITKSRHMSLSDRHGRFAKEAPVFLWSSFYSSVAPSVVCSSHYVTSISVSLSKCVLLGLKDEIDFEGHSFAFWPDVMCASYIQEDIVQALWASTVHGAFTEDIIREMTKINKRPIIFALSNPTDKAECTAEEAYRYSNDVEYNGKVFKPGQGNNSYIFPGVALSAIVFKAKHIPNKAFLLAARRCAQSVTKKSLEEYSRLYPRLKDIRELSVHIAIDVGKYLYENNLATLHPQPEDMEMYVRSQLYSVEYDELINKTYDWPPRDFFSIVTVTTLYDVICWVSRSKHSIRMSVASLLFDIVRVELSIVELDQGNKLDMVKLNVRRPVFFSTTSKYAARLYQEDLSDPNVLTLYKLYRQERITPREKGYDLLRNSRINKGLAFSLEERHYLGLHGLLPPTFMNEEQQVYRIMSHFRQLPDDLSKYVISGIYITINDNSISKIHQILCNWPERDVKAVVVTDGERILGLGDLGCYGMGIPVGKLALYVALAGVQPQWCLPVLIDVGTNNEKHIEDPLYIGLRRKRVRGEEYDRLIDNFMKAVTKRFGNQTLIQFEDFGFDNAFKLLDKYREDYCVFNDDIQGKDDLTIIYVYRLPFKIFYLNIRNLLFILVDCW